MASSLNEQMFKTLIACVAGFSSLILTPSISARAADTPSPALMVLNKGDTSLVIVDPQTLGVVGRVFCGQDPHEVIAAADGKTAYVSNYGGFGPGLHTLSVVDLVAQKPLPTVDLGALRSPHGMAIADGKIYFTAEGSKVIGRYDPAAGKIDWVLGLGQDRTHMIVVAKDGKRIFTSNVNSNTISILEQGTAAVNRRRPTDPGGPGGPPPDRGGPGWAGTRWAGRARRTWWSPRRWARTCRLDRNPHQSRQRPRRFRCLTRWQRIMGRQLS